MYDYFNTISLIFFSNVIFYIIIPALYYSMRLSSLSRLWSYFPCSTLFNCRGVKIHSFRSDIKDHFVLESRNPLSIEWNPLQCSDLNHSFESGFLLQTKWSLIWLLKEWISTPAHLENTSHVFKSQFTFTPDLYLHYPHIMYSSSLWSWAIAIPRTTRRVFHESILPQ